MKLSNMEGFMNADEISAYKEIEDIYPEEVEFLGEVEGLVISDELRITEYALNILLELFA